MKNKTMKNKIVSVLLALAASALLVAAVSVTPYENLVRIQSETQTGDVTAFFESGVIVDSVKYPNSAGWESVSWNNGTKTVTVGGKTMTYAEVMQFVVAIAQQERAAQKAPAQ